MVDTKFEGVLKRRKNQQHKLIARDHRKHPRPRRIFESAPKLIGTAYARQRAATEDAGRPDGREHIGKLEIDRSRIVLLKPAVKARGYSLNLRGHPAAKIAEVLLSFHRSFK